jgi:tripartite-type tricarboxylate transporter receptor subunit TctC
MVTTPGVPSDRLEALRKAMADAMKLPALLEEANKLQLDLEWLSGEESHRIATSVIEADAKVIERAKAIIGAHAK